MSIISKLKTKVTKLQKENAVLRKSRDHWKVLYRTLKRTGQKTIKQTRDVIANLPPVSFRKPTFVDKLKFWRWGKE